MFKDFVDKYLEPTVKSCMMILIPVFVTVILHALHLKDFFTGNKLEDNVYVTQQIFKTIIMTATNRVERSLQNQGNVSKSVVGEVIITSPSSPKS